LGSSPRAFTERRHIKQLGIEGRSKMSKEELQHAVAG